MERHGACQKYVTQVIENNSKFPTNSTIANLHVLRSSIPNELTETQSNSHRSQFAILSEYLDQPVSRQSGGEQRRPFIVTRAAATRN